MVEPVFGLGSMMFELSQSSGEFGVSDLTTIIGVNYRYLFK